MVFQCRKCLVLTRPGTIRGCLYFREWAVANTKLGVLFHLCMDNWIWQAKPNNLFLHRNRQWAFSTNNNNRWRRIRDDSSKNNSRMLLREPVKNLVSKNVWLSWRMFIRKKLDRQVEPDEVLLCRLFDSIVRAQWTLTSSNRKLPREPQLRNVHWLNSKHTKKRWKPTKKLRNKARNLQLDNQAWAVRCLRKSFSQYRFRPLTRKARSKEPNRPRPTAVPVI